jgi:hypothetical protein
MTVWVLSLWMISTGPPPDPRGEPVLGEPIPGGEPEEPVLTCEG